MRGSSLNHHGGQPPQPLLTHLNPHMQFSQGMPPQTHYVLYPVSTSASNAHNTTTNHPTRMVNLLNESYDSLTSANQFFSNALDTSLPHHPLMHGGQHQVLHQQVGETDQTGYMTTGMSSGVRTRQRGSGGG